MDVDFTLSNDDGELHISDAIALLIALFVTGADLPTPFPETGEDPTGDSLGCLYRFE